MRASPPCHRYQSPSAPTLRLVLARWDPRPRRRAAAIVPGWSCGSMHAARGTAAAPGRRRLVAQLHEFRGGIERAPSAVPAAPLARRSFCRRIGRVAIFACSASLRHITAALTARAPHMMRTLVRASLQLNTVQRRASAHLCRAGRLLHSFSAARSATGSRWLLRACVVACERRLGVRASCSQSQVLMLRE